MKVQRLRGWREQMLFMPSQLTGFPTSSRGNAYTARPWFEKRWRTDEERDHQRDMRQYRSVNTWEPVRDQLSSLTRTEFLEAISTYDGLGREELVKLRVDHRAIVDRLDRGLRALDDKLGSTGEQGPATGARGAAISAWVFVTTRRRIQRVLLRLQPGGELYQFGQEWLPAVAGRVFAELFTPDLVGASAEVARLLNPSAIALLLEFRLAVGQQTEIRVDENGEVIASVGETRVPLTRHGRAFVESRTQPSRIDVFDSRRLARRILRSDGTFDIRLTVSLDSVLGAESPGVDQEAVPAVGLVKRLNRLIDLAAAGSGAVVGVGVDVRREGLYRLVWPNWSSWRYQGYSTTGIPAGWSSESPGIYFVEETLDRLTENAMAGELPQSVVFPRGTPSLADFDNRDIDAVAWMSDHQLTESPSRRPARFVLVGGPLHIAGLTGELRVDSRRASADQMPRIAASAAASVLCGRQVFAVGERLRSEGYGVVFAESSNVALGATATTLRRRPRSLTPAPSLSQPSDHRDWWYMTRHDNNIPVSDPPEVIVFLGTVARARRLTHLIDVVNEPRDDPVVVVLLHTPESEAFARAYNDRSIEYQTRLSSYAELLASEGWSGSVLAAHLQPTLLVLPGQEVPGDRLTASIDYLERNYGVQLTPWQVMSHSLLKRQLDAAPREFSNPNEQQLEEQQDARSWYRLLAGYVPPGTWSPLFEPMASLRPPSKPDETEGPTQKVRRWLGGC